MKYWEIEIDGPDRAGKDTVLKYLEKLTNYKYSINVRGYISQKVFSKKFNRNYKYDENSMSKSKFFVLLWAHEDDLRIRGELTEEEEHSYITDNVLFMDEFDKLIVQGYKGLCFCTSQHTPYHIAKRIIKELDKLNKENK